MPSPKFVVHEEATSHRNRDPILVGATISEIRATARNGNRRARLAGPALPALATIVDPTAGRSRADSPASRPGQTARRVVAHERRRRRGARRTALVPVGRPRGLRGWCLQLMIENESDGVAWAIDATEAA
jgi:hypothetical protein